nr:hypothetical protein [Tanacetum cinerariifolium]
MNTKIVEENLKKTQAEVTEGSSKRAGDEIEQESAKRQRLEKEDDSAKLKRCLEIVLEDDDDVTIEATPLSSKSPTIVGYNIYKEGKKRYFRIIRADGNSQNYLTFRKMFKNFNIEDLEVLRKGYKQKDFKRKSFDAIKKMCKKVYKRVNTFVDMNTKIVEESLKKTQAEVTEGSSKRAGDEIEQESAKRQRLEKEDDSAKLKRCLEIVLEDDDDVTIEATPLSSKSPTIVGYKIYKEGKKRYFRIIRADGNSQNYLTFRKMFKNFNIEDLEVLKSIVNERFKKTKPVDDMDNLLF